ncbi:MAG: D-glycerate dehydrogenase [Betaproteobacteria bacterium]|nr:D-glycerate dehydrogenase [Betaproteobacteria bacterium]
MTRRPVIAVENDPFPRLLQAFLDAEEVPERTAAIADFVAHDIADYPAWLGRARERAQGLYPAEVRLASTQAELQAAFRDADAVVTESLRVGAEELGIARRLRVVHKYGTILRNIDVAACSERGIKVLRVRRRANIACAEYAMGLMLALAKKLNRSGSLITMEQLRAAGYAPRRFDARYTSNSNWARIGGLRTLHESTLGIIGLGEIGREVAIRGVAFGMRVVYYQRTRLPDAEERHYPVEYRPLDQLLVESDWVFPLLPSNAATRGIIDRVRLARMKRGACLVNVARAELVDRAALLEALASGHLGGLGLDTFYEEPGNSDDPLLKFDNAIITPRIAAQPRFNAFGDLAQVMAQLAEALR